MRVLLQHLTKYEYERSVFLAPHLVRLKPAAHSRTSIEFYDLSIQPDGHLIHWQQDPFGNFIARIDFKEPMHKLLIDVKIIANLTPVNPFDFFVDESAQNFPFAYDDQLKKNLNSYLEITDYGPKIMQWLEKVNRYKMGIIDFLVMVNQKVNDEISYTMRMQPGVQTSDESLELASGSCRDSAWLLVQVLRHLGLAARFVSGYLVQVVNPINNTNVEDADSFSLHAWAEVYIPGAGWIGLDATSGLFAGEGHIPLACTPVPESAAPITGKSEICKTIFTYNNRIKRF
ncbi:transglutaminase family protein [Chitinophagaceae bacterium LB-8]|jgi:transglutaminase-like putative cysteine protease|uniref:Transglutaminase family protein n=1 Tax=Paraflavisolibacter caeni TaxID=2982496 RepID=A0A9X2XQ50_9BACT|nr:transglutaminase family protein [Paraflavisolibacter caeni]MCU7552644.1 transglutaminase family protein [Paraflavisolibacter caeni]